MGKSFFKKVVVAINGHQSSIQAAMYAIMMCKTYNIALKFVYVIDTATIKYLSMNKLLVSEEKFDLEKRLKDDGEHYLDYVSMLAGTKGLKTEKELREGGIFTEIVKCAQEYEADLIMLGGNISGANKSDVKLQVISTNEKEILLNSSCPVLIVKKPEIEKLFKVF